MVVAEPGNSQGCNRYAYVNNSPVNATDPSGHCVDACVLEIGGLILTEVATLTVALVYTIETEEAHKQDIAFSSSFGDTYLQNVKNKNQALFSFVALSSIYLSHKLSDSLNDLSNSNNVGTSPLMQMQGEYKPPILRGLEEHKAYHEAVEAYKEEHGIDPNMNVPKEILDKIGEAIHEGATSTEAVDNADSSPDGLVVKGRPGSHPKSKTRNHHWLDEEE